MLSDRRSSAGVVSDNLDAAIRNAFRAVRRQLLAPTRPCRPCRHGAMARPWQTSGSRAVRVSAEAGV